MLFITKARRIVLSDHLLSSLVHLAFYIKQLARIGFMKELQSNYFSYFGKNNLSQNMSHFTIQFFLVHQCSLILTREGVSVLYCNINSIEMIFTNILLTINYTLYIISTRHNNLLQALEQCFRKAQKCLSVPVIIILLKRWRLDFKGSWFWYTKKNFNIKLT